MNKKRLLALTIIYILFTIVLINSTSIVLTIPHKNVYNLRIIEANEFDHLSSEFNYRVDTFIENQDIYSTVEFTGWAFIKPQGANEKKEIKLVFISSDNRYEVGTALQDRFDIKAVLIENNISGYKHGFITKFSPLQMENGIYQLFIYCSENEDIAGFGDTGRKYIKTYRTFSEYGNASIPETNKNNIPDSLK